MGLTQPERVARAHQLRWLSSVARRHRRRAAGVITASAHHPSEFVGFRAELLITGR